MGEICWDFPLLGTGNKTGNNNAALSLFQTTEVMDSLAREVCQNSLDAKNKDLPSDVPVKVKFELIYIKKSQYPMFAEFRQMIQNSIDYWNSCCLKTQEIEDMLNRMKDYLQREDIPVLVMSDYNTNGLVGVNAAQGEKSYWDLLVNSEGISIKQDDTSLGSYGIGKYAPFKYSALNLVFYNTLAKDGGIGFQGVAHLVTSQREYDGNMRETQPTGKYLFLKDMFTGRPILPEDNCDLARLDIFQRNNNEYGTDVAVFGFDIDEYQTWEKDVAFAIMKNFAYAIMVGEIEATIKNGTECIEIKKESFEGLLFNEFESEKALEKTRQIFKTINNPDDKKDVKIVEDGDLSIYIKFDTTYKKPLARFRSTGMLINCTEESYPQFSIVIIVNDVGDSKLSKALRRAEPPQHTDWKGKYVKDDRALRDRVNRYLRKIRDEIQNVMNAFVVPDIGEVSDAGIGEYLSTSSNSDIGGSGDDELRKNLEISEIKAFGGMVLYDKQQQPFGEVVDGETAIGKEVNGYAFPVGTGKRKHRKRKKIKVVEPGEGTTKGVAKNTSKGDGKVRIVQPRLLDNRLFYIAGNKYKLYVKSPKALEHVYLSFFAGRDDSSKHDPLTIKNIKMSGIPLMTINAAEVGPLVLNEGGNEIFIEFENHELMAITVEFTNKIYPVKIKETADEK